MLEVIIPIAEWHLERKCYEALIGSHLRQITIAPATTGREVRCIVSKVLNIRESDLILGLELVGPLKDTDVVNEQRQRTDKLGRPPNLTIDFVAREVRLVGGHHAYPKICAWHTLKDLKAQLRQRHIDRRPIASVRIGDRLVNDNTTYIYPILSSLDWPLITLEYDYSAPKDATLVIPLAAMAGQVISRGTVYYYSEDEYKALAGSNPISLKVSESMTVKDVKRILGTRFGVSPNDLRLSFEGKESEELQDTDKIAEKWVFVVKNRDIYQQHLSVGFVERHLSGYGWQLSFRVRPESTLQSSTQFAGLITERDGGRCRFAVNGEKLTKPDILLYPYLSIRGWPQVHITTERSFLF